MNTRDSSPGNSDDPQVAPGPTAILAEDEPLLADELADLLSTLWPQLRIVARAGDGVEALNAIETYAPDLALLDIHMPLLTGIEVARQIAGRCHVAFITSHDEYALDAFEAGAIDYVLKPPTAARLMTTVQRLKARLQQPPSDLRRALESVGTARPSAPRYLQWINASRGASVRLITVDEIVYFKSDQKYTLVVTPDGEALIKKTIKELADELDPTMFLQVHRSALVNVHAIHSVSRDGRGSLTLRLKQRPETLPVSDATTTCSGRCDTTLKENAVKSLDSTCAGSMSRRRAFALLASLGVAEEALAQDASKANPRSYRVVLENKSVRVIEYKSRPGLGVCGEGIHSHPAHLAIALTGAKVKVTQNGKTTYGEVPAGEVLFFDAEVHSAENVGGAGTRFYLVEIKGKDWKPSTG